MANGTLRVRRVTNHDDFRASLESDEHVLPLWFSDGERDRVARTIDPRLATLAPQGERSFATVRVTCGTDDWVLATSPAMVSLARRYAAITGRRLVADLASAHANEAPRSITWFCGIDETDIAGALYELCRTLDGRFGRTPPLGALTAEDTAKLSWLLAKQVVPPEREQDATTTLVSKEPSAARPPSSLTLFGKERSVADVVAGFDDARGILLVDAHSRPHCGILEVADGFAGICGFGSHGASGRCVDAVACYFGEAPRAVLDELPATRVYFNGCTTAGVGGRRADFLPRATMVSHALLRGAAREFVGNVHVGFYGEADVDWFLGASALGCTPAECVDIVEATRKSAGRETIRSALYFGDATNPAWPVQGAVVGDVAAEDARVRISWPHADRVLVARVPDRTWAALAEHDRLHLRTEHPARASVSIVADPHQDASILIVVPRGGDRGAAVEVELRALAAPVERSIGGVLARAVEDIRWLESLPAFATVLANASRHIEEELVALRRAAGTREDVTMLPELLAYAREREDEAAGRFDSVIIDEAIERSRTYWNWQKEYGARADATPRAHPSSCPSCGGLAKDSDVADWANPRLHRTIKVCGYCGIVADLPAWGLGIRLARETLVCSASELTGHVEVSSDEGRLRRVTLGVAVERAGEMQPGSVAKTEILLRPGQTSSFSFSLTPVKPMSDLMQARTYVASEGAFGMINTNLLFGRAL